MMDIGYWVSLHRTLFFHAKKYIWLKKCFKSAQEIWQSSRNQLKKIGLTDLEIDKIVNNRNKIKPDQELNKLLNLNVRVIFYDDELYPENLRNIFNPPAMLYLRGILKPEDYKSIAIVGARKATPYGAMMAEKIAGDLANNGVCVVSGMARGIDTAAHKGCLNKNGRTIAVLGCGVDVVYPQENKKLMSGIMATGAVISEFPLGTMPLPIYFPIRNRIISGLSLGTVVVEAAEKSGSLITADQALEQGREVFAVPGNITSNFSKGPHKLIKQGAKIVENVQDILEEFPWLFGTLKKSPLLIPSGPTQLTLDENIIFRFLSAEPIHIDNLIGLTGLPSGKTASQLMVMELKGLVRQLPGQFYVINYT